MATRHDMKRMTFDVSADTHKRLKAVAALRGISMKDVLLEGIDLTLSKNKIPNSETRQAIEDAQNGVNLTVCKDADDMFKKLKI